MESGNLFIISAPSGTGKTTILKRVMAIVPGLAFSVSHTTRPPRSGELDGVDYYFVDRRTFTEMRDRRAFLEWAEVHGNLYGTSRASVENQLAGGLDIILDIDVQGARQIRSCCPGFSVFMLPPSWAALEQRLLDRGTDAAATIALRLQNARREMADLGHYDYLLVNDELDVAVDLLRAIIIAARSRQRRSVTGAPLNLAALTGHE